MLIDSQLTIANKCPSCGTFDFYSVSTFNMVDAFERSFSCQCHGSKMTAFSRMRDLCLDVPCIGCGESHLFRLGVKRLMREESKTLFCPHTGIEILFIGRDEVVRELVDGVERRLDELMNRLGYDPSFKNSRVMIDALNHVHDIAASGNLYCECGCNQVEMGLSFDRITLRCRKCLTVRIIPAGTNNDLKEIMNRDQILLYREL